MSEAKSKNEWLTIALIAISYALWFIIGFYIYPLCPIVALVGLTAIVALHSSLVHEVLHGHPTQYSLLNETLISSSLNLVLPYRRYKTLHLNHHNDERLTDPFDDPESYYKSLACYDRLQQLFKLILNLNNTMFGRLILGPLLNIGGLLVSDFSKILNGNRKIAFAWFVHIASTLPILFIIVLIFAMPPWQYLVFVVWPAFGLISIRSYAEHQWHENENGRTIIVEKSILSFIFLNNNLHVVHHKHPTVAWYKLPKLYRQQKLHWNSLNDGYVFKNYWELLRKYAFVAKEPVSHPAWRRKEIRTKNAKLLE